MATDPHALISTLVAARLPPAAAAWAYGSGAHAQPGLYPASGATRPVLDYMLAVPDPKAWHADNLGRGNGWHYAGPLARVAGPTGVACVAARVGVGVHFNAGVRLDGGQVRAG